MPYSSYGRKFSKLSSMKRKYTPKVRVTTRKQTAVAKLQRQVDGLRRGLRGTHTYIMRSQSDIESLAQDYYAYNLCNYQPYDAIANPDGMVPVFGTSPDDLQGNKALHKSMGIQARISLENPLNNEEDTVSFSCFLVSLKDKSNNGTFFSANSGALVLTSGVHYQMFSGMALLNKKIFTIHRKKFFTLTNYGTQLTSSAAQTQYGTDRQWYWRLPVNKMIENPGIVGTSGNWTDLKSAQDPSKQYYLIVLNNNSSLDGESPTIKTNIVHTFRIQSQ